MIRRYAEQLLNVYNFIDGLIVTNAKGMVEYYTTFRPDVNSLVESDVLGKHILEVYPDLKEEDSSIMEVLKTGEPIFNQYQKTNTYKGDILFAVNTTLPIKDSKDNIIGAIDVSRYIDPEIERKDISISIKSKSKKDSTLFNVDDIVSESTLMEDVKDKIQKVSQTDSSVLICGETGTGKELVAQSIHYHSKRKEKPFISQNCAAIPATLLESILFGTEKGSYTGAETRIGLFEMANQGTLLLDEINSMEVSIQAKILRAIEEKKIRRIGGQKTIDLDVRILASINEDPAEVLRENKMRQDLFFRLAAVQIHIPSLRKRYKDVALLIKYFINEFNAKMNKSIIGVTEEVEEIFKKYSWPGNVRELKNVIEGAFNLSNGRFIKKSDLPDYIINPIKGGGQNNLIDDHSRSLTERLEYLERKIIEDALMKSSNQSDAANLLGISRQLLRHKLNKYNIS